MNDEGVVNRPRGVITDHRGPTGTSTILEFSSVAPGDSSDSGRVVHTRLEDQEAYDTWHLALLTKELVASRRCASDLASTLADLPRPEKNLLVALVLAARPELRRIAELGCSLFELIDGIDAARCVLSRQNEVRVPDVTDLEFVGVDISSVMRDAAAALHPEHRLDVVADVSEVQSFDFLYDRNVSSYAFTCPQALAQFLCRGQAGLLNLFVSLESTFASNRMGKTLTYFGLEELLEELDQPLFHLFGDRSPGHDFSRGRPVVEGFFMYGPEDLASAWWETSQRDPKVAEYFAQKAIRVEPAATLLKEGVPR